MKKFIKRCVRFFLVMIGLFVLFHFGLYVYCKITPKMEINKSQSYYLYDRNSNLIFDDNDEWVSLNRISKNLINATIYTEDKYFYKHIGFDYLRIGKAIVNNIVTRSKSEGASTITQQYARNLFLNFDKTWKRKLDEAVLAFELETHYSKDEILEGYLNTINYGGVFGIENASRYYFDKSSSELSLAEASILAGIPQSPSYNSPFKSMDNAKKRQYVVLLCMKNNGIITEDEMNEAYNQELVFNTNDNKDEIKSLLYYRDAVIEELKGLLQIPDSLIETGGLRIYTSLDKDAQEVLDKSFNDNLVNGEIESSGIMIDPNNGDVLALIGGRDYSVSQFNRAINSKRQVGSTMKPILYYSALENGLTPASTFLSKPTTFKIDDKITYSPSNYGNLYPNGNITMALAICYSDNIYAIKTHLFLGEDMLVNYAKKMGITSKLEANASLPLGTNELTITEFVNAYSSLANEGVKTNNHIIRKIEDGNGDVIYKYKEKKEEILNKSYSYTLSEMLANTYDTSLKSYTSPTCASIKPKLTKKYAVKSGTTDYDLWTLGYNPDVVVGVWTGYDDNRKLSSKEYKYSKNIWADAIEEYLRDKKEVWYDKPDNVVGVLTDLNTGKVANNNSKLKKILYYVKGSEPGNTSRSKFIKKSTKKTD